jgi:hypothetical protein
MTAGEPERIDDMVGGARRRRKRLRQCMDDLEATIAAPAPLRERMWGQALASALDTLAEAFEHHVSETEAADGFLQQVTADAPRLHPAVKRLRKDHAEISVLVADLRTRAGEVVGDEEPSPAQLHAQALDLLARLAQHLQVGADLIYEAYLVDIGTGE